MCSAHPDFVKFCGTLPVPNLPWQWQLVAKFHVPKYAERTFKLMLEFFFEFFQTKNFDLHAE
jgi:hypothetical protein